MARKAPGISLPEGITLERVLRVFPDIEAAEAWLIMQRWPQGVNCPRCGSLNVLTGAQHPRMQFRCREKACGKLFSTKTGTVMEGSKIGYRDWIVAAFLVMASLDGVSSMELSRALGITQKSAWFLARKLRAALAADSPVFAGLVEVIETNVGSDRQCVP